MSSRPPSASQLRSRIVIAMLVVGVAVYWFKRDRPLREPEGPPSVTEASESIPTSIEDLGKGASTHPTQGSRTHT